AAAALRRASCAASRRSPSSAWRRSSASRAGPVTRCVASFVLIASSSRMVFLMLMACIGTSFCGGDAPDLIRARCPRSDRRDVDGLRALVADLGVIGHLGAFGERLVALAHDALVMDEEILARLVRRDEPEPLLVAEPLHGSSCHGCYLLCVAKRGGADEQRLRTLALPNARPVARRDRPSVVRPPAPDRILDNSRTSRGRRAQWRSIDTVPVPHDCGPQDDDGDRPGRVRPRARG